MNIQMLYNLHYCFNFSKLIVYLIILFIIAIPLDFIILFHFVIINITYNFIIIFDQYKVKFVSYLERHINHRSFLYQFTQITQHINIRYIKMSHLIVILNYHFNVNFSIF
jgi:hypothetical protein